MPERWEVGRALWLAKHGHQILCPVRWVTPYDRLMGGSKRPPKMVKPYIRERMDQDHIFRLEWELTWTQMQLERLRAKRRRKR